MVGKSEPERIFELMGRTGQVSAEVMDAAAHFAEGLESYRAGAWDQARAGFEACRAVLPDDGPSAVFLTRIEALKANPPADWSGVWTLSQK